MVPSRARKCSGKRGLQSWDGDGTCQPGPGVPFHAKDATLWQCRWSCCDLRDVQRGKFQLVNQDEALDNTESIVCKTACSWMTFGLERWSPGKVRHSTNSFALYLAGHQLVHGSTAGHLHLVLDMGIFPHIFFRNRQPLSLILHHNVEMSGCLQPEAEGWCRGKEHVPLTVCLPDASNVTTHGPE